MVIPVYKRSPRSRKRVYDGESDAATAIGKLEKGIELFGLTKGQFSLMELVVAVLNQTGKADVDISVWTAAEADLRDAYLFLESGKIGRLRFLMDRSFEGRQPDYCKEMRRMFGDECIRITRTHAKFVAIRNDNWNIAIRTSMNLNSNPRCENFEISDDPGLCDFLCSMVDEFFKSDQSVIGASGHIIESEFHGATPSFTN